MGKIIFLYLFLISFCFANDVEEKKKEKLPKQENTFDIANKELEILRKKLQSKYLQVSQFYEKKVEIENYKNLLKEIQSIKKEILDKERKFKNYYDKNEKVKESYAFWDQGETTLSQIILEYGSTDYLYIISPEVANIRIHMYSSLPILHECWNEMVEYILVSNGIGIKKVNPYLKYLFLLKQSPFSVDGIASQEKDLDHFSDSSTIFYIFSPKLEEILDTKNFFEKFCDLKQTNVQIVKNNVVIISSKKNIKRLLNLYHLLWNKKNEKTMKVLKTTKLQFKDIEKVIKSFFSTSSKRNGIYFKSILDELTILELFDNNAVLVGSRASVEKAEKIIYDLEEKLQEPQEITFFWYTCKHSDPFEIAEILNKVYLSFLNLPIKENNEKGPSLKKVDVKNEIQSTAYTPDLPVKPPFLQPGKIKDKKNITGSDNFIVDPKTGSILMVVKKQLLKKMQEILKKLDVPKKMVQIDVLLVERTLQDRKQTGINILKIGDRGNKKRNFVHFDASGKSGKRGILDFIFSQPKASVPSIDFALSFLMAQEDLKVNASPSILAVNQTPAKMSVVEELSINNGAIQLDTSSGVTIEKSYTRAQFGITIVITPTIHLPKENSIDEKGFVTLETNVTFDTTKSSDNDKPPVTRRGIETEIRVADGQTAIIGGLRRKSQEDVRDKIPFLGDLPAVGKLFGTTKLADSSTEMFIFITPKIIKDPIEDLKREKIKFLKKRCGDIPEFLQKIEEAKNRQKKKMFADSLKVLFE